MGYSTRGRDAWQALRDHYHQVNNARISELLADFNRPQQPQESVSDFINRIINKRLEIKQAGTEVPHDHARSLMIEGLRKEYHPAISFLRVSEFKSLDILRSKLVQVCNLIDKQQKSIRHPIPPQPTLDQQKTTSAIIDHVNNTHTLSMEEEILPLIRLSFSLNLG